jgi:hypothetical protein
VSHSTNGVHLVDIHGDDVPVFEKDIPEVDGPESWPACIEWDAIHYEVSDPAERAELERAATAAECDRRDAADPWQAMMADGSLPALSGGAPEEYIPTERDWHELAEIRDAATVRDWYDRHPEGFRAWLEANGGEVIG